MASYTTYGRRKGSLTSLDSFLEVDMKPSSTLSLPDTSRLSPSRWERIHDWTEGVNKEQDRVLESAREHDALPRRKSELKRIKEEVNQEEGEQIDLEEGGFQELQRQRALERGRTLQFFETDRVKRFHRAMLMTEVLKEREAQIEVKKENQNNSKDVDKKYLAMMALNELLALEQEQKKTVEKEQKLLELIQGWIQQFKEHEQIREDWLMRNKEEEEECQRLHEIYVQEQLAIKQKEQEQKHNLLRSYQEQFANKKAFQAAEAQKEKLEEERRKLFIETKGRMQELWKEKEIERFREAEKKRDIVADLLAAHYTSQTSDEGELISQLAAEAEAKYEKEQREKAEKREAMLKSIAEHREAVKQQGKLKKQEEKWKAFEMLNAKKAADLDFLKKQQIKAQKKKEAAKVVHDTQVQQMAEKTAQEQCMKTQEQEFHARYADLIAEEERQFQNYARLMIQRAREAQRDTMLLHRAAKEGFGRGHGPVFDGFRPSYIVQDPTRAELPSYWCNSTQTIKELNEATNIQDSKERMGFSEEL